MVFLFSNTVVSYFSLNQYSSWKINDLFPLCKVYLRRIENNIFFYFGGPCDDSKDIIHVLYSLYCLLPGKKKGRESWEGRERGKQEKYIH